MPLLYGPLRDLTLYIGNSPQLSPVCGLGWLTVTKALFLFKPKFPSHP